MTGLFLIEHDEWWEKYIKNFYVEKKIRKKEETLKRKQEKKRLEDIQVALRRLARNTTGFSLIKNNLWWNIFVLEHFQEKCKEKFEHSEKSKILMSKTAKEKNKAKTLPSRKGIPQTEEHKKRIQERLFGRIPWNKGKKDSPETIEKKSIAQRNLILKNNGKINFTRDESHNSTNTGTDNSI